jgi:hypothetical protein
VKAPKIDFMPFFRGLFLRPNFDFSFETTVTPTTSASLIGLDTVLSLVVLIIDGNKWIKAEKKVKSIIPIKSTKNVAVIVLSVYKLKGQVKFDFECDLCVDLGLQGKDAWTVIMKYE